MVKTVCVSQMVVVLTITEICYLVVGLYDDLLGSLSY